MPLEKILGNDKEGFVRERDGIEVAIHGVKVLLLEKIFCIEVEKRETQIVTDEVTRLGLNGFNGYCILPGIPTTNSDIPSNLQQATYSILLLNYTKKYNPL